MRYNGLLYRALNPVYAKQPLSGEGAARYGGRFNTKGIPALYTSLLPETAIKEANQAGSLQPTTLVSYKATLEHVFDCRRDQELNSYSTNMRDLASSEWRDQMLQKGKSSTQEFSNTLIEKGFCGLLVPSFAKGATESDLNLVLWIWDKVDTAMLNLIDDENRLSVN